MMQATVVSETLDKHSAKKDYLHQQSYHLKEVMVTQAVKASVQLAFV